MEELIILILVFEDEGRYIRVLLPNQIFIRTFQESGIVTSRASNFTK